MALINLSGFLILPSSRPIDLQFELMVFVDVWVIVPSHKCEVKFWVIYSVNIILSTVLEYIVTLEGIHIRKKVLCAWSMCSCRLKHFLL